MATFLYQCPITRRNVQGWVADEPTAGDTETYVSMKCLVCGAAHLVNPKTGRIAGPQPRQAGERL
jgi:hypothetical protein